MADKKKSNLLKPSNPAQPVQTYTRNNLYSVDNSEKKTVTENKTTRGKRTSVSCFQDTKNKLQAMITIMDKKNVDEVIETLLDSYCEVISDEELSEFRLMTKSLDKRTIKR